MSKYKYYLKKPQSEIAKDIISWLATAGAFYIAASSPYFVLNLMHHLKNARRYEKKQVSNVFYRLKRSGSIKIEKVNHQIYISLTAQGKKKANWLQIDNLQIKKPNKWDGKWRLVMFDIGELKKLYREAFRGKLKELGFVPLQKSVWMHPFDCRDEILLLKDFFGLSEKELRLVIVENLGNDEAFRRKFKI